MRPIPAREYPEEVEGAYRKARRLEWLTVAYVASATLALGLTMGGSQAMRASFLEDAISVLPAVAFLVGTAAARRRPRTRYPYGTHRATSIAYLAAALALCGMGVFLLVDAALTALSGEKTTIGGFPLFGTVIWAGWPMLAAVAYTAVPSWFLGRAKARLAPKLHDKVLHADARMMRADWMAETATATGVLGSGFGLPWLDPLAAALIGADVLKDGAQNLGAAVTDLVDRWPRKADGSDWERLPQEVGAALRGLPWVADAEVRMREEGHVFLGEAFVVPKRGTEDLVRRVGEAADLARGLDWRVHELVIMPVDRLPGPPPD